MRSNNPVFNRYALPNVWRPSQFTSSSINRRALGENLNTMPVGTVHRGEYFLDERQRTSR